MHIDVYNVHGNYYGLGITWWRYWQQIDIRFVCFNIEISMRDELKQGFRIRYHE